MWYWKCEFMAPLICPLSVWNIQMAEIVYSTCSPWWCVHLPLLTRTPPGVEHCLVNYGYEHMVYNKLLFSASHYQLSHYMQHVLSCYLTSMSHAVWSILLVIAVMWIDRKQTRYWHERLCCLLPSYTWLDVQV